MTATPMAFNSRGWRYSQTPKLCGKIVTFSTYTFWYSSGDNDPGDNDFNAFMAVDIDRPDNICIFKNRYVEDDYFTEKDYLLNKGFIMNKLAADYQASKKVTLDGAVMYMMTAEDIEYGNQSDNTIGFEIDDYLTYKIYDNLVFGISAGYLFADDALDFYEKDSQDGNADENIFVSSAGIRYNF
ncbi:MAG: hypothetical protein JXO49_12865 [Deltaproteobacteria bacterium]|nr:hypothetical protein [Candidatus Anaeroferrophillus wilburensis]MBN2890221.1 hypothetical protein [Deltaproteobacteria bacterium]